MQSKRFWMVKGLGPTSAKHHSRQAAEAEAQRLACTNPGQTFFVMEAVAVHVARATDRYAFDGLDEGGGVPF